MDTTYWVEQHDGRRWNLVDWWRTEPVAIRAAQHLAARSGDPVRVRAMRPDGETFRAIYNPPVTTE